MSLIQPERMSSLLGTIFGRMSIRCPAVLLLVSICFSILGSAPDSRADWKNEFRGREFTTSVVIPGRAQDYMTFVFNRGPNRRQFLFTVLQHLSPRNVRGIPGFESPWKTRVRFHAYQLHERKIVDLIGSLLEAGYHVQVVVDPSTFTPLEKKSASEVRSWLPNQQAYWLQNYDKDGDGKVGDADVAAHNRRIELTLGMWPRVEGFRGFGDQFELITPPYEFLPADENAEFPRLAHIKGYGVDFESADGEWEPVLHFAASANATDSGMALRVARDPDNIAAYIAGEGYQVVPGAQGHVQTGVLIRGSQVLQPLLARQTEFVEAFRGGGHFDSLPLPTTHQPRVVFEDGTHRTTVQAIYSEGATHKHPRALDPFQALADHLDQASIYLTHYYSTHFVATNANYSRWLHDRVLKARADPDHPLQEFGVVVDHEFATQGYSAIPVLVGEHRVARSDAEGTEEMVRPGFAYQPADVLPADLVRRILVYRGDLGIEGFEEGLADKLHSKTTFAQYWDANQQKMHYVITIGSANESANAGKNNADVFYLFDTTDPELGEQWKAYAKAVYEDERNVPWTEEILEVLFQTLYGEAGVADLERRGLGPESFAEVMLRESGKVRDLTKLAEAVTRLSKRRGASDFGKNLAAILRWAVKHSRVADTLTYSDLGTMVLLAYPDFAPLPAVVSDLERAWLDDESYADGRKKTLFRQMVARLKRGNPHRHQLDRHCRAVLEANQVAMSRLGPVYGGEIPGINGAPFVAGGAR